MGASIDGKDVPVLGTGHLLDGRYRLDERIATGGMGDVWRGTDVVLGRVVAVKVLRPAIMADPEFAGRFYGEARMMAALRHPFAGLTQLRQQVAFHHRDAAVRVR